MRKKEYVPRISDILGMALILASLVYFFVAWVSSELQASTAAILFKLLLKLPIFLLPTLFVILTYSRYRMRLPDIPRSLGHNESAMLTVSTFGAIVLMQMLYSSVFPFVMKPAGVAETESALGFILLFLSAVVIPAVLQEIFFRGVVLRALTAHRVLLAILIASVSDALMRFSLEAFPIVFFCGFLIGSLYFATGSLSAVIGVHLAVGTVWFLGETVGVYFPTKYELFMRIFIASSVLLLAFGLPFLKKTVRAILADEHDDLVLPVSAFWGAPIVAFLVLAITVQIIFGSV